MQLEQVIVRPGGLRNQLDGRQLKICSTGFDIAVGLLRVIEMIVSVYPQVFVAGVTQHSDLLLRRLLQVTFFRLPSGGWGAVRTWPFPFHGRRS